MAGVSSPGEVTSALVIVEFELFRENTTFHRGAHHRLRERDPGDSTIAPRPRASEVGRDRASEDLGRRDS
jgi:hypothetical protein